MTLSLNRRPRFPGPYAFVATVGTFLMSKEYIVMEHDFWTGVSLFIILSTVVTKFGPDAKAYINAEMDAEEAKIKAIRQDEIDR